MKEKLILKKRQFLKLALSVAVSAIVLGCGTTEFTEEIPDQLDMSQMGDIFVSPETYDEMVSNSDVGIAE